MSISLTLVNEIRIANQTSPAPLELHQTVVEDFWNWFMNNATELTINYETDYSPDNSYLPGICFRNAQILSYLENLTYFEGFLRRGNDYIYHGLNGNNQTLIDFTILNNQNIFQDFNGELPTSFVGIEIPVSFVIGNRYDDLEEVTYCMLLIYNNIFI